jgi:hypothetical protein
VLQARREAPLVNDTYRRSRRVPFHCSHAIPFLRLVRLALGHLADRARKRAL